MFELSEQKSKLLNTQGHILVLGGPGSGKTTIALLKAKKIIEEGIKNGQCVLFLSFARATITRVEDRAVGLISKIFRQHLEITTYHSFAWNILKSHGYLLNSISPLRLISPHEAASRFAGIKDEMQKKNEKHKIFVEEGIIDFDLFSILCAELLSKSKSLTSLLCDIYPIIILDEFQDTNAEEWNLIQILGEKSLLIALADPEQRIYEFRGADPVRIGEFITKYKPTQFDLGSENNRSQGTDIVQFGNDLLTGANKQKKYNNVYCKYYPYMQGSYKYLTLKTQVINAYKRLNNSGKTNWSLAILVPSNNIMLQISEYLESSQNLKKNLNLKEIKHEVALETAGPFLSALLIAGLLEGGNTDYEIAIKLIKNLCEHIRGRNGNKSVSKAQLTLSKQLLNYINTGKSGGKKCESIINECKKISRVCQLSKLTGDPSKDWLIIRRLLSNTDCESIRNVAADARFLRLLHKGSLLSSRLSELWNSNGNYNGAVIAVNDALVQEHFATSIKVWSGIHLMTMHKAKGKEFDEVIIYEGYFQGKIIKNNYDTKEIDQARLKLRVAVTRAMKRATILIPKNNGCCLI